MSYTIVDDNGVLEIRASLRTPHELTLLIEKLDERRQKLLDDLKKQETK